MTREFIINALTARGIKAEATEMTKNGIVLEGIVVGDGRIRPTIYTKRFENEGEIMIDEVIKEITECIEQAPEINVDADILLNWDWAKTRLKLCIQKKTDEPLVKRDFLDLEQYVRVMVDEESSLKVSPHILEEYGVSEDALFNAAIDCTRPLVVVQDMTTVIAELMDMSVDEVLEMQGDKPPMIVVTNKSKLNGSSTICFTDVLKEVADTYEKDLIILPSSIHECILHTIDNTADFRAFDSMIREINATQVQPEEVLSDHAYRFIREENRIVY